MHSKRRSSFGKYSLPDVRASTAGKKYENKNSKQKNDSAGGLPYFKISVVLFVFYTLAISTLGIGFVMGSLAWFVPSELTEMFYIPIIIVPAVLGGFFSYFYRHEINDYYDNRPEPFFSFGVKKGGQDFRFLRASLLSAVFGIVAYVTLPILLTVDDGNHTTKTFKVIWVDVHKGCDGFKNLPTKGYGTAKFCGIPHAVEEKIKRDGSITFSGYESIFGFRGTKIISPRVN